MMEPAMVPLRKLLDTQDRLTRAKSELNDLRELNDALAAKVAEWKARAEKAEAALKAAEDDRHLTTPCT